MRGAAASLKPGIRLTLVLVVTVGFFVSYNKFLVDYSLEDMKVALNSVEKSEFKGLDRLFDFAAAAEASEVDIKAGLFANIEYVGDVISTSKIGRGVNDIRDLMKQVVDKKAAERGNVLNALDAVNRNVAAALGFRPKLRAAISRNEKMAALLIDEAFVLSSQAAGAKSLIEKQSFLYKSGVTYMKALAYPQAISSFRESIALDPQSQLGARSLFNKAWCEKTLGNLDESARDFQEFLKLYPEDKLAKDAEFQIAILNRKEFKYKEAADALVKVAEKYENSEIAPVALFQAAGTYSFDLGDEEAAKKIFEALRDRYPVSELSSSKTTTYMRLAPEAARRNTSYHLTRLLWNMPPLGTYIREAIDRSSTRFISKAIRETISYIDRSKLDKGDAIKIEKSDADISKWLNRHLDIISKNLFIQIKNVSVRVREGNEIEVQTSTTMGGVEVKGYLLGRLELKREPSAGKEEYRIALIVEQSKFGPVNLPPEMANASLERCQKIFNQKLPFAIRKLQMDAASGTILFEGTQRVLTEQLRKEHTESYEEMYKGKP